MSLLVQALILPDGSRLDVPAVKHDNTALTAIVLPGTIECSSSLVQLNRSEHLDAQPAICRTTQHITLSGYTNGRRKAGWAPPAVESSAGASAIGKVKVWAPLQDITALTLVTGVTAALAAAGALGVLAVRLRRPSPG
eukprot:SAG31_NODE_1194_length_9448_cov_9.896887_2_plen_138_part_00